VSVVLAVDVSGTWLEMRWFEWLGVAGFPLTILGFALTWWQARKAAKAADAARVATSRTRKQLTSNQLLVRIPQLGWIARELDVAIEGDNREFARRFLDQWRSEAGNIRGILGADRGEDGALLRQIQEAVSLAAAAGTQLLMTTGFPVSNDCARARDAINATCDALNVWAGKHSIDVLPGGEA
jgi:hypothetical protein